MRLHAYGMNFECFARKYSWFGFGNNNFLPSRASSNDSFGYFLNLELRNFFSSSISGYPRVHPLFFFGGGEL